MFTSIGAWLIGKTAGPVLAVALGVTAALALVQTARIEGVPLFGGGLKSEIVSLTDRIENPVTGYIARLTIAKANGATLEAGLGQCNASVREFKAKADAAGARLDAALAELRAQRAQTAKTVAAILASKPGPDLCTSADALILRSIK